MKINDIIIPFLAKFIYSVSLYNKLLYSKLITN